MGCAIHERDELGVILLPVVGVYCGLLLDLVLEIYNFTRYLAVLTAFMFMNNK
jgi:hypothetical protein